MNVLTWVDYLVLVLVLLTSISIGLYYKFTGGKQSTLKEYILADQSMSPWPVAFSLMASFQSAISLLGGTQEAYSFGTQFFAINIAYILATPIASYVYLPVFYNRGGISAYEYLEQRFGRATRTAASIAFTCQMTLYSGIVLYAPSVAISAVTGLEKTLSVLVIGAACTFYSTIGGIKAVLWTDVFQSLLMFAAVYIVIFNGWATIGFTTVFSRAYKGDRLQLFNFDLDPTIRHTMWTQVVGGGFIFLSLYAVNQAQVQRLLTTRNLHTSRKSLWMSLPILIIFSLSLVWAGLTIYAQYYRCDPVMQKRIASPDQILPLYVTDTMQKYPGVIGLFIAGLLSGSLSTLSSSINSLAAVTLEDYIKPLLKTPLSPAKATFISKILALLYGLLTIALSFVAEYLKGVLQASLTIFGVVGGPLLGLFTLGMLFPFTSQKSSLPAFLLSLSLGFWIGFGGPKPLPKKPSLTIAGCPNSATGPPPPPAASNMTAPAMKPPQSYFYLYRLSYQWYTFIGFSTVIILGCLIALAYPERKKHDKSVFSPILARILQPLEPPVQSQEKLTDEAEQQESGDVAPPEEATTSADLPVDENESAATAAKD